VYRAGRQAEALAILRDTRGRLTDELGIDPSVALRRLESDILAQSSTLDWHRPTSRALLLQRATAPVVVLELADPGRSAPTTGRSGMGPPLPAVWNVGPRNPGFVGRDGTLRHLRERLQSGGNGGGAGAPYAVTCAVTTGGCSYWISPSRPPICVPGCLRGRDTP
jgi:hypothetical protein